VGDGAASSTILSARVSEPQLSQDREGVLAQPRPQAVPTCPPGSPAVSPLWTDVCRSAALDSLTGPSGLPDSVFGIW